MTLDDDRPGTKPATITLSAFQLGEVDRARGFLTAAAQGTDALAEFLGLGPVEDTAVFYATDGYGVARHHVAELLAILAALTAAGRHQAPECGPFESEREVRKTAAVRSVYESFDRDHGPGRMTGPCHRILDEACTAAGVELGAYDHCIMLWLASFGPVECAVVAGLITRARAAGEATGR
jgi:hypothetical protein